MEKIILTAALIALGLLIGAVAVRLVMGPRATDRILCINVLTTLITASICLLSLVLKVDYLLDVALIYALLGFTVNTLLTRSLTAERRKGRGK